MSTPANFAASRMLVPSGTTTCRPSMVSVTCFTSAMDGIVARSGRRARGARRRGGGGRAAVAHHARRGLQLGLELVPELLETGDHGRRAAVAQHADGLAGHVVGDREQRVEVA